VCAVIENEWPGHRHKLQIKSFFLCVFSMYLYIPVRYSSTHLNPIKRNFFRTLSSRITSRFNYEPCDSQHLVLEREQRCIFSPITVQHQVQFRSSARQVVYCVFVQNTASRYYVWDVHTKKIPDLSKHASAEDCGVKRIRHCSEG